MANRKEHELLFEPIVAPKRNFEIIEASIRREIYSGALVPGQKLPNEFELARQFNVGRSAVREALKVLEDKVAITVVQAPRMEGRQLFALVHLAKGKAAEKILQPA